jgi:hypothetical protein
MSIRLEDDGSGSRVSCGAPGCRVVLFVEGVTDRIVVGAQAALAGWTNAPFPSARCPECAAKERSVT